MNLNNYENRNDLLIEWMLDVVPEGASFLDIGANDGSFCPETRRIAEHAGLYAGVDPDTEKLERHPLLDQRFFGKLETADIPTESFDCVFAIYVLEHVADDLNFIESVARVLKPGGSFFFITPNGQHYFAAIAGALARIGLQERVLRMVRSSEIVGEYHYPALYRLNSPSKLRQMGRSVGLGVSQFRYSESFGEFSPYFPGPLKAFPWVWERMAEFTRKEVLLGNLMGHMKKDAGIIVGQS